MNKVQVYWDRLHKKAEKEASSLHNTTGFKYRTTKQINGYHVEGYSPATNKWYTVKVISHL